MTESVAYAVTEDQISVKLDVDKILINNNKDWYFDEIENYA